MTNMEKLMNRIGAETVEIIVQDIESKGLVKTGTLRDSIAYALKPDPEIGISFNMVYYGNFLDLGTIYIEPREFFRVNIEAQLQKYGSEIAKTYATDLIIASFKKK